jgi:hypothetical protein
VKARTHIERLHKQSHDIRTFDFDVSTRRRVCKSSESLSEHPMYVCTHKGATHTNTNERLHIHIHEARRSDFGVYIGKLGSVVQCWKGQTNLEARVAGDTWLSWDTGT